MVQMIDSAIPQQPPKEPRVNWEDLKGEKNLLPRDLSQRLRGIASRLDELEPRSMVIAQKITDIENAHAAADQLPTDLAELAERKEELLSLVTEARTLSEAMQSNGERIEFTKEHVGNVATEAEKRIADTYGRVDLLISKSEQALRGATSVGLSKSFSARKDALARSGKWWVGGLVFALASAIAVGWERVSSLREVLSGNHSTTVVLVNALLAVLGVGAPVWFAWLSTKQIGTVFRLSEDYAFKASVAQAYEGFRAEAITIDEGLRSRLFASALDRFEEAPIRLIDATYHSSPLQELLNNPGIRKALEGVPGIAEKIIALVPTKTGSAAAIVAPSTTAVAELVDSNLPLGNSKAKD